MWRCRKYIFVSGCQLQSFSIMALKNLIGTLQLLWRVTARYQSWSACLLWWTLVPTGLTVNRFVLRDSMYQLDCPCKSVTLSTSEKMSIIKKNVELTANHLEKWYALYVKWINSTLYIYVIDGSLSEWQFDNPKPQLSIAFLSHMNIGDQNLNIILFRFCKPYYEESHFPDSGINLDAQ